MPSWKDKLIADSVPWLLEPDETQPAIRYYMLRDILGRDENDKEVEVALPALTESEQYTISKGGINYDIPRPSG